MTIKTPLIPQVHSPVNISEFFTLSFFMSESKWVRWALLGELQKTILRRVIIISNISY